MLLLLLTYDIRLLVEYMLEVENTWPDMETLHFYFKDHFRTIGKKSRELHYHNSVRARARLSVEDTM